MITAGQRNQRDRARESEHGQKVDKGNRKVYERRAKQERIVSLDRQLEVTETTVRGQSHRANHKRREHLDNLGSQQHKLLTPQHVNRNLRLSHVPHQRSKSCLAIHQC